MKEIPEFIFQIRGNKPEMLRVANEAADYALELYKKRGIRQTCSDILANGIIDFFYRTIQEIDHPVEEILSDRKRMFYWMNTRFFAEISLEMMKDRVCVVPDIIYCADYGDKNNSSNYPHMIASDLHAFCIFVLLNGATPDMLRKHVRSKDLKPVMELQRISGEKAFFSILARSCIAYLKFAEIIIKPVLDEILLGKCTTSINRLHVVQERKETTNKTPIKTECKKNQVCSLQDLQSLVR